DNPFGVRQLLPGGLFGAAGLEVLKLIGSYYLTLISHNITAQTLGGFVGLIVWINVVARFAFFTACWTATIPAIERARATVPPSPTPPPAAPVAEPAAPAAPVRLRLRLRLGLLVAGALAGAAGSRLLARRARHQRARSAEGV